MKHLPLPTLAWLILLAPLVLSGCQTSSMKAAPSTGAGFVPLEQMRHQDDLPFQKVWIKAGVDWKAYTAIFIKDVNTKYLIQATWWQQNFRQKDMEKDVADVSAYMRQAFITAFRDDPNHRFRVLSSPEPGSLTLEMAMTELIPSNPVLEALSIVAPYGSGVAVQAAAKESGSRCTVAFEARIVDSASGEVLAMAADREQGKFAPVNLNGLTWYGEAHVIIDEWAGQYVQIANRHPGEVIKEASPFTLMPW